MEIEKFEGFFVDYKDIEYIRISSETWIYSIGESYETVHDVKELLILEYLFNKEKQ